MECSTEKRLYPVSPKNSEIWLELDKIMSTLDQIKQLWELTEGDLGQITQELVSLIHEAHNNNEVLPLQLEFEILLQANYVIGFGGAAKEITALSQLLLRVLDEPQENLDAAKIHRLGCTVSSAIISHLSSSQHLQESPAISLVPWANDDLEPAIVLQGLVNHLFKLIDMGTPNDWSLELITFITTLLLILEDLGSPFELGQSQSSKITNTLQSLAGSQTYEKWTLNFLEKSDYYRFVTLMLTQKSRDEEIWLDYIKKFII